MTAKLDDKNWNQLPKLPLAKCETCPLKENKQVHFVFPKNDDFIKSTWKKPNGKDSIPNYNKLNQHDYIFMGMHGGNEEVRIGETLVGPSGQVVRQTSEQLEIKQPALINAVACAPDEKELVNEEARRCCEPAILRIIKELNPKLLFSMGPESLRTAGILPSPRVPKAEKEFKITKVNGIIEKSKRKELEGLPIMQLIHPAFFLRVHEGQRENPADAFGDWVDSLYYGVKNLKNPVKQPTVKLIKTVEQLRKLINSIPKGANIGIDIETKSLKLFEQILCIQIAIDAPGFDPTVGYVIPIPEDIRPYYDRTLEEWNVIVPDHRQELYDLLKDFLEGDYRFIAHGGMFDAPYLYGYGFLGFKLAIDTHLLSHLVNENSFNLGLKPQVRTKLSWPEWDERLFRSLDNTDEEKQREQIRKGSKKVKDWSTLPKHALYRYAGWDPCGTVLIYKKTIEDAGLSETELNLFTDEVMPTLNMFLYLRFTGIQIDPFKLVELKDYYAKESLELYEDLHSMALDYELPAFNPNSSQQLAELLFDKIGFNTIEGMGRSTDRRKVLERLPISHKGSAVVSKTIEFKELRKEMSTYIFGVWKFLYDDLCVHPYYNLTLKTGRMSATDPSVLNIKKGSKLRSVYVPHNKHKDWMIFEGDQSQCELRVLTGATKSKRMIEAFTVGFDAEDKDGNPIKSKDIHGYFSKLINPSMTLEEIEKGGYRTRTKNVVFGKVYRASILVMAEQMLLSSLREMKKTDPERYNKISTESDEFVIFYKTLIDQAEMISGKLDELCPELKDYEKHCIGQMDKLGYTESLTGRRRHFPLVTRATRKHSENQACNSPIQDTANAINWHAMRIIYDKYTRGKNPPVQLWFSTHDNIVGEIDPNRANEILPEIIEIGQSAAGKMLGSRYPIFNEIPFVVDMKVGTNLGNTKDVKDGDYRTAVEQIRHSENSGIVV